MKKRLIKTLVNVLHVIVILMSLYSTLGATVYDVSWDRNPLITYCLLCGGVLLPLVFINVIIWYTIKRNDRLCIFFSDLIQIVVSAAVTFILAIMSRSVADLKFIFVWFIILLMSILIVVFQKNRCE